MIKELANKAISDKYLQELLSKLELIIAKSLFFEEPDNEELSNTEIAHLIRFADILSFSDNENARNLSYKIISLLYEYNRQLPTLEESFKAILVRLGNFPAITYLESQENATEFEMPLENKLEESIKRIIQAVPKSKFTFTDSQYKIYELIKSNKHFSFSGPTSLGKSFILESFIKHLIQEERIKDNIAILVPTRALINQNLFKLREEFEAVDSYEVLAHPQIPQYIRNRNNNYIFVFTPERLISYLSDKTNPSIEYLFIDEAHKVIAEKDTRNPLYYHSILQAQKKSIRLYFASPNVSNPEIYLKLFDRSTDESVYTVESPVSQNKYFLNLSGESLKVYGEFESHDLKLKKSISFFSWLKNLSSSESKSIVYCNSKEMTRDYAIEFAKSLPKKKSKRIDALKKLIQESIHEEYFLIDCLSKGIGFHFGDLPQRIRIQIENLFKDGELDFLFCTSTLLEGVNLPAKNIFVLSDKIGISNFRKVDFLNLIGRAGRLTKEFSGNIIIVKEKGSKAWDKPEYMDELIKTQEIPKATSQVLKGNKNFYENIVRTINEEDLTNKNTPNYAQEILDHYSNIALIHSIEQTGSTLLNTLLKEKPESSETLREATANNHVPIDVLKTSSSIKLKYQNKVINTERENLLVLPGQPTYQEILEALNNLYNIYDWAKEEQGRSQILKLASNDKHENLLRFYAVLISDWMDSKPLKYLIDRSIDYQHNTLELYDENGNNLGIFNKYNRLHVNIAINKLLTDIENLLRFRFIKYFNNYYLLLKHILGEENAGANWGDFLEYGSTKKEIIELQNTGLPRHLATYIFENYSQDLSFDKNGNLLEVNSSSILQRLNSLDIHNEIKEFYK